MISSDIKIVFFRELNYVCNGNPQFRIRDLNLLPVVTEVNRVKHAHLDTDQYQMPRHSSLRNAETEQSLTDTLSIGPHHASYGANYKLNDEPHFPVTNSTIPLLTLEEAIAISRELLLHSHPSMICNVGSRSIADKISGNGIIMSVDEDSDYFQLEGQCYTEELDRAKCILSRCRRSEMK